MIHGENLSEQASKLVAFFDDRGFPFLSELVEYLDTNEAGRKIRKVGTSVFGIRHKFTPEMSTEEKMSIYATFRNPFYLGSFDRKRSPLDSLELLAKHFDEGVPEGRQEFEYFASELIMAINGTREPDEGVAFSVISD